MTLTMFTLNAFYGLALAMNMFIIASGLNLIFGVLRAAAGLAIIALVIERLLLRHLYDKEHLMQLLFTFALVLLMSDAAKMIWGTDQYSVGYPPGLGGAMNLGFVVLPQYQLFLCVVGPAIALAMWLLVDRTRWGRIVRAATQDREMLAALGVNVPMVYAAVFTIGSALAGVGGGRAGPRGPRGAGE